MLRLRQQYSKPTIIILNNRVVQLLFLAILTVTTTAAHSSAPSISILKATASSAITMPPQQTDASALGELKEIIRRQASDIAVLQQKLQDTSSSSSTASHGHGPPVSEDAEALAHYLGTPFYRIATRRVLWLSLFLCSLSLTAVIMRRFEHTLSRQIELAYFVPLLAGHGSNTGGGRRWASSCPR